MSQPLICVNCIPKKIEVNVWHLRLHKTPKCPEEMRRLKMVKQEISKLTYIHTYSKQVNENNSSQKACEKTRGEQRKTSGRVRTNARAQRWIHRLWCNRDRAVPASCANNVTTIAFEIPYLDTASGRLGLRLQEMRTFNGKRAKGVKGSNSICKRVYVKEYM